MTSQLLPAKIKNYPVLFSLCVIALVFLFNKIPLSDFLITRGVEAYASEAIEDIIFNCLVSVVILYLLVNWSVPFRLYGTRSAQLPYYIPLLVYLVIFSGRFSNIHVLHHDSVGPVKLFLYGLNMFCAAFLEEFLFRGLILGLLLQHYHNTKDPVFRSALVSSLIFGSTHLLNLWSDDAPSVHSVFNQLYATACLGFMYGAVYLKTKRLLVLTVIHFLSNFFAGLESLSTVPVMEQVQLEKSFVTTLVTEVFRIVIFGIPFLIGFWIIKKTGRESDLSA